MVLKTSIKKRNRWAIISDTGRIKGYDVPEFLVSGDYQKPEKRANPVDTHPNKPNFSPNKKPKG